MTDTALPSAPDVQLDATPQPSPTPAPATASQELTDAFASSNVTFRIIEANLHVDTHDPEVGEVVIPLKLKTKLVRKIMGDQTATEMDQFFGILEGIGDRATTEKLDNLDIMDTGAIVARYFAEFEKRQAAGRGESHGSHSS